MINMDCGDSFNLLHKHIIYQKAPSLSSKNTDVGPLYNFNNLSLL